MPQADKKPPVNKANTEYINDFSGGLNTTISGSLLTEKEAQVAENVSFEQKGTIVPRKGRRKRYSAPFVNEPISGLGQLYKQDGTARLVISAGTNMYSDKPNLSTKWTSKADFDVTGASKTKYIDTTSDETAMSLARNYLPRAVADCKDKTLFIATDVTLADETSVVKFNGNAIKATLNASKTVGFAKATPSIDRTKLWVVSAYICNGNAASGVRIVGLKTDGTVVKGSDYVTSTSYTKATIKFKVDEIKDVTTIGLEVKGAATQYGYIDGLILRPITQTDYDNASYISPEFTDFEPINTTLTIDTTAQWNEGTKTDLVVEESISGAIGSNLNSTQNLSQGILIGAYIVEDKLTIDTNLTWEPYAAITWDAMILL
jgi:hypothetical protein